jgi:4-amino-4-deoxy-L-arabinose transferase-like glycosyltransferase
MSRLGWRRALIGIALGGLVLRVIYAYVIVKSKPLNGDALEFHLQANLLADGHGYIQPFIWASRHVAQPTADKPPVYPSLEALLSLFGGRSWGWHDLVGILAGTATIVVTGLLGRRVGGERLGLIAAALTAVYPLLIAADGSLRSESVFALLVTLALLQTLRLRETPSVWNAALLGVIIALATLTRSEGLLLVVLLPFGVAGLRRGLATVAACALVLLPWFVRCWIAFDQPILLSTNAGGLLAGANCRQTYGGPLIGQWTFQCIPKRSYSDEAAMSSHLADLGLRYAESHAGRLPVVIAARIGRSFELFRVDQQWRLEAQFEGRDVTVEKLGVLVYYIVAALAIAGTLILRRRHGPWLVLLTPLVLVLFVSITAYGFTRFRVGAEPALIVLAAVAVDALITRWRPAHVTPEESTGVPAAA